MSHSLAALWSKLCFLIGRDEASSLKFLLLQAEAVLYSPVSSAGMHCICSDRGQKQSLLSKVAYVSYSVTIEERNTVVWGCSCDGGYTRVACRLLQLDFRKGLNECGSVLE